MKKLLALIMACAMVLALVACGGGAASTPTPSGSAPSSGAPADDGNAPSGDKVAINVIAAQYGTQTADWWAQFVKDFEAAYSDIDLTVDVVSWNDIYTVVNTRISNGEAPDILNIDVFADYQADGLLLPAQDYVSAETYAKMYPAFLDQSVVDGTVWPSCSAYMGQAIEKYGYFCGIPKGLWRICRCNPWAKGGYDPVKDNYKGKAKWLL